MKTRLTFLFTLICLISIGQYQTPFPDSLASWHFQSWIWSDPGSPNAQQLHTNVIVHARDTVHMNGLVYSRLFADPETYIYSSENCQYYGNLVGYHRIEGDKVFYLTEPTSDAQDWSYFNLSYYGSPDIYSEEHFNTSGEILLYDFGLAVGDSFALTLYDTIIVQSIDSVSINNHFYKRLNFSGCSDYHWIEGLGSSFGYFPYAYCFESGGKAMCFHEYYYTGAVSYPDSISSYEPPNGHCWLLYFGQDELSAESYFTTSPNPVQETLQLEFTEESNFVEIYNSTGQKIDEFNVKGYSVIYDVSVFRTGVYFIKVNNIVQKVMKN